MLFSESVEQADIAQDKINTPIALAVCAGI